MFTQDDKEIARALLQSDKYVELLTKVFLTEEERITDEVINEKTNKELGEIVRANHLANVKVRTRFAKLKQLASENKGKPNPAGKA